MDELEEALRCGDISKELFDLAIDTCNKLKTGLLRDIEEFKRKPLDKIADRPDPQLEPARLAPSAINSQPWYFVHGEDAIHAYCVRNGRPGYMNQIDMGIALAHLYVANPETFRFCQRENPPTVPNYTYTGTITL
jgi:hypothetical protein